MKILCAGFKGNKNTSYHFVGRSSHEKLLLTNSFSGVQRDIEQLEDDYDKVYLFGVRVSLRKVIQLEVSAEKNGRKLNTSIDLEALSQKLQKRE